MSNAAAGKSANASSIGTIQAATSKPTALDASGGPCFQHAWRDGACNTDCNNRECGYDGGDCSLSAIIALCVEVQRMDGVDYKSPPSVSVINPVTGDSKMLTPTNLQLELSPARLNINPDLNEMVLYQEIGASKLEERRRPLGSLHSLTNCSIRRDVSCARRLHAAVECTAALHLALLWCAW